MKLIQKNFILMAGVISTVLGTAFLIPSFIKEIYWLAVASAVLMILGLIFLAIAFGD